MKMTDPLGRVLSVDLVFKTESLVEPGKFMWTRPLEYNLEHAGTTFARVPHGAFALRVMSAVGAELLVHQDGKLLIAAQVEKGVQYVERDAEGNQLYFAAPGQASINIPASDAGFGSEGVALIVVADEASDDGTENSEAATLASQTVPTGHGLVFVVARLAQDEEIVGSQPPQVEYELDFQLSEPAEHDRNLAGSLSKLVAAPLPPDCNDLTSLTPPEDLRPTFVCSCTGCKTGR